MVEEFEGHGIQVVAVSSNSQELAERSVADWRIEKLTIGYGLGLDEAEQWGLFVSSAASDAEPDHFTEPGIFVVRPNGTLYASIVQTMPFSRPPGSSLLKTLEWVIENDYPARGEVQSRAT